MVVSGSTRVHAEVTKCLSSNLRCYVLPWQCSNENNWNNKLQAFVLLSGTNPLIMFTRIIFLIELSLLFLLIRTVSSITS